MNTEKKDAVVILGAGIMQIPAIRTAGELGFSTLVFDGNPEPAGKNKSDVFNNVDIKDLEALYIKCTELSKIYTIRGVFTAGTDFSYIVAQLAEKLKLPGISYETALKATVKSEMRKAFKISGVSSPSFVVAGKKLIKGKDYSSDEITSGMSYPLVVKPVDSMGGRGSVKIEKASDIEKAVKNAAVFSRSGSVIIEEYIEGAEFSLDAVIDNGNVTICGIADRHIFFPPYFVEMGHTMPSCYPEEVLKRISSVFEEGIHAIGIDNGAAKGDIKYTGEKAVVGEIAARLSGGYMSGWTFPYSTGVSVTMAALNVAVGNPSGLSAYKYKNTAAERAFISIPGTVSEIVLPAYLEEGNRPEEIKDVFLNKTTGDSVVFPKNNVQKCGNIIAVHKDRKIALEKAEKACRDILVRLQPCIRETEEFLFQYKEPWIPDAFSFENPENIRILELMEKAVIQETAENTENVITVAVTGLPAAKNENSRDWQGRGFLESLNSVMEISGCEFENSDKKYNIILGTLFWDAFRKGGIQGGLWIIDTIKQYINNGELPDRFL